MKARVFVAFLLGVQFAAAHIDILAALHQGIPTHKKFDILSLLHGGHKKKPQHQDPTGVLSKIMAAAGQGLALAEQHHEVAVKDARGVLQALLDKESGTLGHAIQAYNRTLTSALAQMHQTQDTSKKALAKAQKESQNDSWDSKAGHAQATLNAQLSFVEREVRKAQRKQKASMRQAISNADFLLEGGVTKLSRKVGDISDMVKKAQDDIEAAADVATSSPVSLMDKGAQSMDVEKAVAALKAVTQGMDAAFSDGLKTMTAGFGEIEKSLDAGAKAITAKLEASQQEELKGVRSASATQNVFKVTKGPKPALRPAKKHV